MNEVIKAGDCVEVLKDVEFIYGNIHKKGELIRINENELTYYSLRAAASEYKHLPEPCHVKDRDAWMAWYIKCHPPGGIVDAIDALHVKLGISMID